MRNIERIEAALHAIPADARETWLRMGMAVKSELGEAGFTLWDAWSQSSEAYQVHDGRAVWHSIQPEGGVTIATLFHEAKGHGWQDTGHGVSPALAPACPRVVREDRQREKVKQATAQKAFALWQAGKPVELNHPYLQKKQVAPVDTLREIESAKASNLLGYVPQSGDAPLGGRLLVVPVKVEERLSTVELIDEAGRKTTLRGRGTKTGGFWAVSSLPEGNESRFTLLIGEGVATALSVNAATGYPAIAVLSCGNLPTVAEAMRQRYPKATLVILADVLKTTDKPHPKAVEAARVGQGRLALPQFGPGRSQDATDFNDMATLVGLDAVKNTVHNALSVPESEQRLQSESTTHPKVITFLRGDGITPEPIHWLWEGWLARGKMHILGGAPGTGKTSIALALAATVTLGGKWPDARPCRLKGEVAIWSGEDEPKDTLAPRLLLSGADMSRVHFITQVHEEAGPRAFDPAKDMDALQNELPNVGQVRLLIVDPIVLAIIGDSHKNAEVRRSLQPLADLGTRLNYAVLGITHFTKGTRGRDPVERITGSLAFGAAPRVVMVAGMTPRPTV